jgi:hypothetical protein
MSMQHKLGALLLFSTLAALAAHQALAQEPNPATSCGSPARPGELAILGTTIPPVDGATVRIPELNLTYTTVGGCYEFRNVVLPHDPMLVSFEVRAEGYRSLTWLHYLIESAASGGIGFNPPLRPGTEPDYIDFCSPPPPQNPAPTGSPQRESAYNQEHAALCAQLPSAGTGPGVRTRDASAGFLLLLVGFALLCAGITVYASRRTS